MPKLLIFDAFTLLIPKKTVANYALLRCKTFSLKIWVCKIFDKFHVWTCIKIFGASTSGKILLPAHLLITSASCSQMASESMITIVTSSRTAGCIGQITMTITIWDQCEMQEKPLDGCDTIHSVGESRPLSLSFFSISYLTVKLDRLGASKT